MHFRCSIVFEGRRPQGFRTDNESLAEVFGATDFIQKLNAYRTLETIRYKSISTATIILQPNRRTKADIIVSYSLIASGSLAAAGFLLRRQVSTIALSLSTRHLHLHCY